MKKPKRYYRITDGNGSWNRVEAFVPYCSPYRPTMGEFKTYSEAKRELLSELRSVRDNYNAAIREVLAERERDVDLVIESLKRKRGV